jgi:gamma-butyrobetaine dioxygenase
VTFARQQVEALLALLAEAGSRQYGGEEVTQLAHALQSAALAELDNAPPALIVAALLHDVGHLLADWSKTEMGQRDDDRHEHVAADFLDPIFGAEVAGPVRLHVAAKRYLCISDPGYAAQLSDASRQSLSLQGGPFTAGQANTFARSAHADSAIRLRRWDEAAKDPAARTRDLRQYAPLLRAMML